MQCICVYHEVRYADRVETLGYTIKDLVPDENLVSLSKDMHDRKGLGAI